MLCLVGDCNKIVIFAIFAKFAAFANFYGAPILLCALPRWRLWQNCHFRHICQIRLFCQLLWGPFTALFFASLAIVAKLSFSPYLPNSPLLPTFMGPLHCFVLCLVGDCGKIVIFAIFAKFAAFAIFYGAPMLLCALPRWRLWQNCHFRHMCQIRRFRQLIWGPFTALRFASFWIVAKLSFSPYLPNSPLSQTLMGPLYCFLLCLVGDCGKIVIFAIFPKFASFANFCGPPSLLCSLPRWRLLQNCHFRHICQIRCFRQLLWGPYTALCFASLAIVAKLSFSQYLPNSLLSPTFMGPLYCFVLCLVADRGKIVIFAIFSKFAAFANFYEAPLLLCALPRWQLWQNCHFRHICQIRRFRQLLRGPYTALCFASLAIVAKLSFSPYLPNSPLSPTFTGPLYCFVLCLVGDCGKIVIFAICAKFAAFANLYGAPSLLCALPLSGLWQNCHFRHISQIRLFRQLLWAPFTALFFASLAIVAKLSFSPYLPNSPLSPTFVGPLHCFVLCLVGDCGKISIFAIFAKFACFEIFYGPPHCFIPFCFASLQLWQNCHFRHICQIRLFRQLLWAPFSALCFASLAIVAKLSFSPYLPNSPLSPTFMGPLHFFDLCLVGDCGKIVIFAIFPKFAAFANFYGAPILLCALPCWRLWQNCHFRHICQIRRFRQLLCPPFTALCFASLVIVAKLSFSPYLPNLPLSPTVMGPLQCFVLCLVADCGKIVIFAIFAKFANFTNFYGAPILLCALPRCRLWQNCHFRHICQIRRFRQLLWGPYTAFCFASLAIVAKLSFSPYFPNSPLSPTFVGPFHCFVLCLVGDCGKIVIFAIFPKFESFANFCGPPSLLCALPRWRLWQNCHFRHIPKIRRFRQLLWGPHTALCFTLLAIVAKLSFSPYLPKSPFSPTFMSPVHCFVFCLVGDCGQIVIFAIFAKFAAFANVYGPPSLHCALRRWRLWQNCHFRHICQIRRFRQLLWAPFNALCFASLPIVAKLSFLPYLPNSPISPTFMGPLYCFLVCLVGDCGKIVIFAIFANFACFEIFYGPPHCFIPFCFASLQLWQNCHFRHISQIRLFR